MGSERLWAMLFVLRKAFTTEDTEDTEDTESKRSRELSQCIGISLSSFSVSSVAINPTSEHYSIVKERLHREHEPSSFAGSSEKCHGRPSSRRVISAGRGDQA